LSGLVVKRLESLDALRRVGSAWDDLWWRSENTLPTARAELLAEWCERFARHQPFLALTVERDGQLVGALPLVTGRRRGIVVGQLPTNAWSPAGDLMLDPQEDESELCALLLYTARQGLWPLLWLDALPADARRWHSFLFACQDQRLAVATARRFTVDTVRVEDDWNRYSQARSANHRKQIRRAGVRAAETGSLELVQHDKLAPEHVEPLLRTCFAIEAGGWKGQAQTAVLQVPGMWDFFLQQARQLAAWEQLSVNCLEHDGVPIAFEYGWRAKGVYCSPKVAYDEKFSALCPGQMLRGALLERFHADEETAWVDFLGPSSRATKAWATNAYSVDRLVVSLDGLWSRALVTAYSHYRKLRLRLRRDNTVATTSTERVGPPPTATPCARQGAPTRR
jgi:CelD/BcsL family acetyltransferase involved in cellulose biosynthesis